MLKDFKGTGIRFFTCDSGYLAVPQDMDDIPYNSDKVESYNHLCYRQPADFLGVSKIEVYTDGAAPTLKVFDSSGVLLSSALMPFLIDFNGYDVYASTVTLSSILGLDNGSYFVIDNGSEYLRSEPLEDVKNNAQHLITLDYRNFRDNIKFGVYRPCWENMLQFYGNIRPNNINTKDEIFVTSKGQVLQLMQEFNTLYTLNIEECPFYLLERIYYALKHDYVELTTVHGEYETTQRFRLSENENLQFDEIDRFSLISATVILQRDDNFVRRVARTQDPHECVTPTPALTGDETSDGFTVTWNDFGAQYYEIEIAEVDDFSVIYDSVISTGDSYTFTGLPMCDPWFVRIRSVTCDCTSDWLVLNPVIPVTPFNVSLDPDSTSGGTILIENITTGDSYNAYGDFPYVVTAGDTIRITYDLDAVYCERIDTIIRNTTTTLTPTRIAVAGDLNLAIKGYVEFTSNGCDRILMKYRYILHSCYDQSQYEQGSDKPGYAKVLTDVLFDISGPNPSGNDLIQANTALRPKNEAGYINFTGAEEMYNNAYNLAGRNSLAIWCGRTDQIANPLEWGVSTIANRQTMFDFGQALHTVRISNPTATSFWFHCNKKQRGNLTSRTRHVSQVNAISPNITVAGANIIFQQGNVNASQDSGPFQTSGVTIWKCYDVGGLQGSGSMTYSPEATYGFPRPVLGSSVTLGNINPNTEEWNQSAVYFYGGNFIGKFYRLFIAAELIRDVEIDAIILDMQTTYL